MKTKYFFIVIITAIMAKAFAQQNIYYPVTEKNSPTAYIGVPFTVNGNYQDREGDYKVVFRICDEQKVCVGKIFYGPDAKFLSTSPEDAGKDIEVTIFYRDKQSGSWKAIKHDHVKVVPAPLKVVMLEKIIPSKDQHV